ncbi:SLC13 family permease [Sanyastnella coralliicola]|uniref:SLC13 family permease n=1 Tax=Sanyastnella coralliicola TaxID=3069118 RepID=UPI0027B9DC3A|nr:DASS family sodium-coupled anion symporter [Longitalea sp. SCSIO 12813]
MKSGQIKLLGLIGGPVLFLLLSIAEFQSLPTDAGKVLAVAAWMLVWWVTEAVPIAATALLPLVLYPLTNTLKIEETAVNYGSKYVFLFMGGFLVALAMEKWQLHRRIALNIVSVMGDSAQRIVFGFMLATAFLSMWISNTATTLMMLPIAMSVISLLREQINDEVMGKRFAMNLLLGVAYAANCGGIATLVGTPPNAAMAGIISDTYGVDIGFGHWMLVGLPFSLIMLISVYFLMIKVLLPLKVGRFNAGKSLVSNELTKLGRISRNEVMVLWVFVLTAALWIFRGLINDMQAVIRLNDSSIAMISGIALFMIPSDKKGGRILDWKDTEKLPWGILLLFGGGLALANGFKKSGLVEVIAEVFAGQEALGLLGLTLTLTLVALFLTEVMSNLALVVVFVPVVGAIAEGMGLDPLQFAVPVTLAASCAFMLPMATPPNAIVFASGEISIPGMARVGVVLNLVAVLVATLLCSLVLQPWLAGV